MIIRLSHLKNLLILLLVVFTMVSCMSQDEPLENPPIDEEPIEDEPSEGINYLALGDSYTIGQGVEMELRWPNQLGKELEMLNFEIGRSEIIAKTGWTTKNLLDNIKDVDPENYNLVSLLIGVNNQYQNKPFEVFTTEFDILISKSIEIAGDFNRVFVVSIPDYGVTPFGSSNSEQIGLEIDMYNEYMFEVCKNENIPFIDITGISRDLGASEGALASDNLHPSGAQYTEWVDKILPVVIAILEQ